MHSRLDFTFLFCNLAGFMLLFGPVLRISAHFIQQIWSYYPVDYTTAKLYIPHRLPSLCTARDEPALQLAVQHFESGGLGCLDQTGRPCSKLDLSDSKWMQFYLWNSEKEENLSGKEQWRLKNRGWYWWRNEKPARSSRQVFHWIKSQKRILNKEQAFLHIIQFSRYKPSARYCFIWSTAVWNLPKRIHMQVLAFLSPLILHRGRLSHSQWSIRDRPV